MSYTNYLEQNKEPEHALFGGSNYSWANKERPMTEEEIIKALISSKSRELGTFLHEKAEQHIKKRYRYQKGDKHEFKFQLMERFPLAMVQKLDIDFIFTNLMAYVNDSIDLKMDAEVKIKFTEEFFGTADALIFDEAKQTLIIHDLKTGVTKPSLRQLEIYAGFYCLMHNVTPKTICLRLYYMNDIIESVLTHDDLIPLINITRANAKMTQRIMGAK